MSTKDDIELKKIVIHSLEELLKNGENLSTRKKRKTTPATTRKRGAGNDVKNPELKFYDPEEKKFYNNLTDEEKNYVAVLEDTIRNMNKEDTPIRFKVLLSNIDEKIKAIAIKKVRYLYDLDASSSEYYKMTHWIESLCKIPIGKYKPLPVTKDSPREDIRQFIVQTKKQLDDTVYGHTEAKDQIIRLLAQWISNPEAKGMVIGIQGSPGVGKTKICKDGISKALGLPFSFLALGGASDSSWLDGHSYTYEGSTWGKVVDILMKAEYMNPVLFLDELDKVSQSHKGDEIINTLIHITDSTQNDKFMDKYFVDVEFDLSRCLIIFSYNDESAINPILKDRMVKIRTDGYKLPDKIQIAQKFLIPEAIQEFNLNQGDIVFPDECLKYIVETRTEDEEGVRNLKRAIENIVSNINLNILLQPNASDNKLPVTVSQKMVNDYVKLPKDNSREKIRSMYT